MRSRESLCNFQLFGISAVIEHPSYRRSRTRESPLGQAASRGAAHFWGVLRGGTGPKRFGTMVGFIWLDSQDLLSILDLFRSIFVDLGPGCLSET